MSTQQVPLNPSLSRAPAVPRAGNLVDQGDEAGPASGLPPAPTKQKKVPGKGVRMTKSGAGKKNAKAKKAAASVPAQTPAKSRKAKKDRPAGDGSSPVVAVVESPLDTLIAQIKAALHEGNDISLRMRQVGIEAIHWAHRVGGMLIEAKDCRGSGRGRGSWETWGEDTFDLSEKLANNYMRVAKGWSIVEPLLEANPNYDSEITLTRVLKALAKPRKRAAGVGDGTDTGADRNLSEEHHGAEAAGESAEEPAESEDPAGDAGPGQEGDACNTSGTSAADAASGNSLDAGSSFPAEVQAFYDACQVIIDTEEAVITAFYFTLEPKDMPTILGIVKQARPHAKEVGKRLMNVEKFLREAMKREKEYYVKSPRIR